jgi:hypothetical protein
MKTKLAALLISLCASAQASLIELTPGGFSLLGPLPPAVQDFIDNHITRDAFVIASQDLGAGWDQNFLQPPRFQSSPLGGATAVLSWDLEGTAFTFGWLFVIHLGDDFLANFYQVSDDQAQLGGSSITIDGIEEITRVVAYGFPSPLDVPDSGSSLILGLIAFAVLAPDALRAGEGLRLRLLLLVGLQA